MLALNPERVALDDTLLRRVRGGRNNGGPARLRAVLKKLRRKLGEDAVQPRWIFAERGVGYPIPRPPPRRRLRPRCRMGEPDDTRGVPVTSASGFCSVQAVRPRG